MAVLWRSAEIASALNCVCDDFEANGVEIDSRKVKPGDIFIAIKGNNFDGAKFIDEAFAKGAVAAITQSQITGKNIINVSSCQKALWYLAIAARARMETKIIAITGSVGKTGVKDALASLLSAPAAEASFNNHWGVPLTLTRIGPKEKFGVVEIGMSGKGEIGMLSQLAKPDFIIITKIALAHLEFFDSIEGIAASKAEIFEGVKAGGSVLLNRDDDFYDFLAQRAEQKNQEVFSFGSQDNADARLLKMSSNSSGAEIEAEIFGKKAKFSIYIPSIALALNAVGVIAAANFLGKDIEIAAKEFSQLKPREGRGLRTDIMDEVVLIDESYNANPASVLSALESLKNLNYNRSIAVLGDMAELGSNSIKLHEGLLEPICKSADLVFTYGEKMNFLNALLPKEKNGGQFDDLDSLCQTLTTKLQKNDIVMVKGSLIMGLGYIVKKLKELK